MFWPKDSSDSNVHGYHRNKNGEAPKTIARIMGKEDIFALLLDLEWHGKKLQVLRQVLDHGSGTKQEDH